MLIIFTSSMVPIYHYYRVGGPSEVYNRHLLGVSHGSCKKICSGDDWGYYAVDRCHELTLLAW